MKTNTLAIVGGGTAGLLTALILKQTYPKLQVDIIESDRIGIVGVGEGSTEHWQSFMGHCNISTSELVEKTDATFKYGINFQNWNGDDTYYIQSVSGGFNVESQTRSKMIYSYLVANDATPQQLTHDYIDKGLHTTPYWGVNQFHFNTMKLNTFLHEICEKRHIGIIKAEIDQVNLNTDGEIDNLVTTDGTIFQYDFYVDSTGFHKLIVHKSMGVPWKSWQEYLPMNSAIAFPTERTEHIDSWTTARAMSAGWLWRIPTQNRWGNGYVFNDKFLDFDGAKKEAEEYMGHPIEVGKQIKFDAGCLEKAWHKNCVAIGLSGSFIEPLEASSIGTSIQQAFMLAKLLPSYVKENTYAERTFNQDTDDILENILEFVALHYMVKREDTPFWQSVKELPLPPGLKEKIELFNHSFPGHAHFTNRRVLFKESNWILVMHGLGILKKEVAQRDIDIQPNHVLDSMKYNIADMIKTADTGDFVGHREALQWIIDNKEQI